MLEVRNLKKNYRSKKGGSTEALKGVSLKLPDTGLVFILGKSGCGKSTFLNLLGGLDSFDGGEIIINGKSSKDFTQSDFDSYRNTYLGFVFQEFNIIDTFSIEKNIALALQLQHKKEDSAKVEEILAKVELEGYGKRRTNELSGGQKQRVAIARALVKDPEIILADEPTGALDSATGKAVLNTLRKLSKEKLVVIVSHDREFAEEYADRIVELKDGLVISDRSRTFVQGNESLQDTILPIDKNIIVIPKGKILDAETVNEINNNLLNSKQDTFLLLAGEKETEKAYPAKMEDIRANGLSSKTIFTKTDDKEIVQTKEALNLIKSKLPWKDAFRIGISNFKSKKFRLVLTIILSMLSLCLFGLADIFASYDRGEVYTKAFNNGKAYYMQIGKNYETEYGFQEVKFSKDDINYIDQNFGGEAIKIYSNNFYAQLRFFSNSKAPFFQPQTNLNGIMELSESPDFIAYGRFPQDYDEMLISDYMAKAILTLSLQSESIYGAKEHAIPTYEQLVNTTITVGGAKMKIVGVFKTNYHVYEDYFKDKTQEQAYGDKEVQNMQQSLQSDSDMFYRKIVVMQGYQDYAKSQMTSYYANASVDIPSFNPEDTYIRTLPIIQDTTGVLQRGQIYIPYNFYNDVKYGWESTKTAEELDAEFATPQRYNVFLPTITWDKTSPRIFEKEFEVVGLAGQFYGNGGGGIAIPMPMMGKASNTIIGGGGGMRGEDGIVLHPDDFREILDLTYVPDSVLLNANISGAELFDKISTLVDSNFSVSARHKWELQMVDSLMGSLINIFYIVAAVLAFFVILLLYNFISSSIHNKKKEIGILRAIGARGRDIMQIFLYESLVLGLIIIILSIPLVIISANVIQNALIQAIPISIISFKIRQVFTMTGITLLIMTIASFLPVFKISKKKPIDAILNK